MIRILSPRSVWTTTSNGADGVSDIEGKATRVGARMESLGASDIDGKTERLNVREHMSQSAGSERVSMEPARVQNEQGPNEN